MKQIHQCAEFLADLLFELIWQTEFLRDQAYATAFECILEKGRFVNQ